MGPGGWLGCGLQMSRELSAVPSISQLCFRLSAAPPSLSPAPVPPCLWVQRELRQLQLRLGQLQSSSQASLPAQQDSGAAAQQAQQGDAAGSSAASAAAAGELASSQAPLDMRQLAFPLRPIGILRSCFSRRNGTPRQPLLVPAARARLTLRPEMSGAYLEGLQEYSHW